MSVARERASFATVLLQCFGLNKRRSRRTTDVEDDMTSYSKSCHQEANPAFSESQTLYPPVQGGFPAPLIQANALKTPHDSLPGYVPHQSASQLPHVHVNSAGDMHAKWMRKVPSEGLVGNPVPEKYVKSVVIPTPTLGMKADRPVEGLSNSEKGITGERINLVKPDAPIPHITPEATGPDKNLVLEHDLSKTRTHVEEESSKKMKHIFLPDNAHHNGRKLQIISPQTVSRPDQAESANGFSGPSDGNTITSRTSSGLNKGVGDAQLPTKMEKEVSRTTFPSNHLPLNNSVSVVSASKSGFECMERKTSGSSDDVTNRAVSPDGDTNVANMSDYTGVSSSSGQKREEGRTPLSYVSSTTKEGTSS